MQHLATVIVAADSDSSKDDKTIGQKFDENQGIAIVSKC